VSRQTTFLLAAVSVLCGLLHCQRLDEGTSSGPGATSEVPDQESWNSKDGTHASVLTAERGVYHRSTQDMEALGNVTVISDAGDTLKAEELRWNNTQRKILADGPVRMSNPQGVQTGVGLRSSANLEDWTLSKVTGQYEGKLE